ncbi:MAG: succinate dehydrogenase, cytochrome b556 subunit [Xanthomonadales bacterium]|nr:succinate dehydrogenase, cytochrome b556 subunit [Xanthomonadales bacterium]
MNQRPLSPHLQVYKPQLTSVLSITHRATGIVLAGGALLAVYWLYALASGASAYAEAQALLASWFGKLVLMGMMFALFYHLLNGIRHLFWDAGHGLELKSAYQTGWAVVILSAILTLGSWAFILGGLR